MLRDLDLTYTPYIARRVRWAEDTLAEAAAFACDFARRAGCVVAIIPGEVVQLVAGAMYGVAGGAAIILIGCVISSAILYGLSSRHFPEIVGSYVMRAFG